MFSSHKMNKLTKNKKTKKKIIIKSLDNFKTSYIVAKNVTVTVNTCDKPKNDVIAVVQIKVIEKTRNKRRQA